MNPRPDPAVRDAALAYLATHQWSATKDIAAACGRSARAMRQYLKRLEREGAVMLSAELRNAPNPAFRWSIKP